MPNVYTTFAAPVARRFVGLAKEATPGTAVMPTYTWPMTTFTPVDKITYLEDGAWRSAMAGLYNIIRGVRIADISLGGPMLPDGIGYTMANMLGDYWQSVNGTAGSATTLSSPYVAGATTVSSGGSIATGTTIAVGALGSTAEEVRTVTNTSGSGPYTLTLSSPMYQGHNTGAAVTPYSAVTNYTHNFSLLNAGIGAGGYTNAQPPTYTWMDYTGLGGTSGTDNSIGARQYAYSCLSEVVVTGTATGLIEWTGKGTALASAVSGTTPTIATSGLIPQASWLSTVTIGGTQVYNNAEWKLTTSRKLSPYFTNSGQADPFAIIRGTFTAELELDFSPAVNESEFLYYLNNTQPTVQINASNGLTGGSATSMVINANTAAFTSAAIEDSKEAFGYNATAMLVANTTNAGPSGSYSPLSISVTNSVVSY